MVPKINHFFIDGIVHHLEVVLFLSTVKVQRNGDEVGSRGILEKKFHVFDGVGGGVDIGSNMVMKEKEN